MDKIKEFMEASVERGDVAGCNVLIMQEGREIYYAEAGYANIEEKTPFARDSIMRIFSMTKPIVAAAIMLLIERGVIAKMQPVEAYLPGFKDIKVWSKDGLVSAKRSVIINDLMSMTSGLTYLEDEINDGISAGLFNRVGELFNEITASIDSTHPINTIEAANRLGKLGLAFNPGERWLYGSSADVLGAIIEVATNMSLGEFLKKEFFEPLNMADTAFFVPRDKSYRLADVYRSENGRMILSNDPLLGMSYDRSTPPAFQSGGAGLVSTIDDYSHFAQMLLNGGIYNGRQLLSPATAMSLSNGAMTPWQNESMWRTWQSMVGYTYGNLMRHNIYPGMNNIMSEIDEYGWDGMLGTFFAIMPHSDIIFLIGQQTFDAYKTRTFKEFLRNVIISSISE